MKFLGNSKLNDTVFPELPYLLADKNFVSAGSKENVPLTILVVIDTEEEFDWNGPFDPKNIDVENILEQHRAQAVFSKYGVVPTYVIDYPVANDPAAVAVLDGFAKAGTCQIGAHLHPWVTPPDSDYSDTRHSYPGNLPKALERQKIEALTAKITSAFGQSPVVYRPGAMASARRRQRFCVSVAT